MREANCLNSHLTKSNPIHTKKKKNLNTSVHISYLSIQNSITEQSCFFFIHFFLLMIETNVTFETILVLRYVKLSFLLR